MKRNKGTLIFISAIVIIIIIFGTMLVINKHGESNEIKKAQKQVSHAPVLGNKDADNTIVLYADFSCPHCRDFDLNMLDKIKNKYVDNNKANIRFVNGGLLGDDSIYKSAISYSVYEHAPDKYWELNRQLFEEQTQQPQGKFEDKISLETKDISQKSLDSILRNVREREHVKTILGDIGFSDEDMKQIERDVKDADSNAWQNVMNDRHLMKENNVKNVPAVYVNGKQIQMPTKFEEYNKIIKKPYTKVHLTLNNMKVHQIFERKIAQ
ncbi:DsbA family protein [Staphylococcus equorum]|uniref:DsbA family protein n=1 Tax=Staphylococcus equorum TaxID=246432 RepID=A0A9X4QZP6_9STAP|nr:thioredoxin domain-containing protein [Staphylococcus equorum]MDG0820705.1 DsbA family protein [Staphylococcus equorum]MDG0841330.1 DsbA family protein [Staphylococcus equorum]MDG0847030.1 DsbA family protein [Staphylococcus equorum]